MAHYCVISTYAGKSEVCIIANQPLEGFVTDREAAGRAAVELKLKFPARDFVVAVVMGKVEPPLKPAARMCWL